MRQEESDPAHRVLPDGCADLLFGRDSGNSGLQVVGPMTRYRDFKLAPEAVLIGVRFHPGMWSAELKTPGDQITDEMLPLDLLWGARAGEMQRQLEDVDTPEAAARVLDRNLPETRSLTPAQRAIAAMREQHGCCSVVELADQAGLSERQFRRVCLAETGLSPKFLARVLRFRHAMAQMNAHPCALAHLALDCGYYDQAHFINEFRELSGRTPGGRFFQSP